MISESPTVEFPSARLRGLQARMEAQKIAFGPVVFQCLRSAWKSGLLAQIEQSGEAGASVEELAADCSVYSPYAISVLLETALSAGALRREDGRYRLTRVGDNVLHDTLTQINIDYIHDVCYQGLFELDECLRQEKPLGLKNLGDWATIYEGLSALPEPARSSWFRFDHYYSDSAFAEALPYVLARRPQRLMDIGANTGKWAKRCLEFDADVHMHLVDLPEQIGVARANLQAHAGRVDYFEADMLDAATAFPAGQDAIWMSQFLSCFSAETMASILRRVAASLNDDGHVFILDTFWDRQRFDIAAYCIINTSPYFTAMANGVSKMYRSQEYIELAAAAGLRLVDIRDGVGLSHSLLTFAKG